MSNVETIEAALLDLAQKPYAVRVGNTAMTNPRIADLVKYLEYLKAGEAVDAAVEAETMPGIRTNVLSPMGAVLVPAGTG